MWTLLIVCPFYGTVLLCNDDARLRPLLPRLARRAITYGVSEDSDFRILRSKNPVQQYPPLRAFCVEYRGRSLGEFHLQVPGHHNVLNATAAVGVGVGLDLDPERIREGLEKFGGVDRRFQLKGRVGGVSVIDDYGHHPTEIRATLAAAKDCRFNRVHVVFQPHRYTRTRDLLDEFAVAFSDADSVFVLDIYPASEQPIPGITGERVAEALRSAGKAARYMPSFEDAAREVVTLAETGDMILTLGAGSVSHLGPQVLEQLKARDKAKKIRA